MKTHPRRFGVAALWAKLRDRLQVRHALPCVGLVVLGGSLSFVITPDDPPARKSLVPDFSKPSLPLVILDAGHGGNDEGTKWRGLAEKKLTLDLAFRTQQLLRSAGFRTKMTRQSDVRVELSERVRMANEEEDAFFVSIHFNSSSDAASSGIETYYARQKAVLNPGWMWIGVFSKPEQPALDTGETLAGAIQASLANRTEARNRGIRPCDYYVVHRTRCPAVLVEAGFLSNAFEGQLLANEEYRNRLAQGIAEGVAAYQKSRPQPLGSPPPQPLAQASP